MILRERGGGGGGGGGGSSIMLLGTCGSYGWQNNTWRRWWKIYCAPLACKPPPPPNFKTWIRLWWLRCRWLLTPRTAPKSNFQQSSVVALNQAAPIPFLPGAGDIYVCADEFFCPKNDAVIIYCCYFESNGAVSIFFKNNVDAFPIIRRRKHGCYHSIGAKRMIAVCITHSGAMQKLGGGGLRPQAPPSGSAYGMGYNVIARTFYPRHAVYLCDQYVQFRRWQSRQLTAEIASESRFRNIYALHLNLRHTELRWKSFIIYF